MVGQTQATDRRVGKNLEEDPRTGAYPIEVINTSGLVELRGKVPSSEIKEIAYDIAKDTDGVISVTNALIVDPDMEEGGEEEQSPLFPPVAPSPPSSV